MLQEKIQRLQRLIKKQTLDILILANTGHEIRDDLLYYLLLTHLEQGVLEIPTRGKPTLHAISFEVASLQGRYPSLRVLPISKPIAEYLHGQKKKRIAYRPSTYSHLYDASHLSPFHSEEACMGKKLPKEISRMQNAANITDDIFSHIIQHWENYSSEADVARDILVEIARAGVEPSFAPIVASGIHAANPHHTPTAHKLKKGFCVIDMGIRYDGYCSDMTRTIYLGTPSKKENAIYTLLKNTQAHAIAASTPGKKIAEIASAVREELGEYNHYFSHALGHGLGTQVHEWPPVSIRSKVTLEPNMVITIEPGIYVQNSYGIRIEDDIVITNSAPRLLTKSSKELIIRK